MADPAAESAILHSWATGALSPDEAFERLYDEYGRVVYAWLAVREPTADADDLFQDVWSVFCRRWREWSPHPDMAAHDARPVLSFLFRTCHLVLMAHRRMKTRRAMRPLEDAAEPMIDGDGLAHTRVQLSECLTAARDLCTDEELAVLTAKLSGVPARDIARTLQLTETVVDHRYRNAIARIRERLNG